MTQFKRVPKHRLSEDDVRIIRAGRHYYGRDTALARLFGVTPQTVNNARHGLLYKKVRGEVEDECR